MMSGYFEKGIWIEDPNIRLNNLGDEVERVAKLLNIKPLTETEEKKCMISIGMEKGNRYSFFEILETALKRIR